MTASASDPDLSPVLEIRKPKAMPHQCNDVHVIVRSVNERTTSVATRLARAQLPSDDHISVIKKVPFEAALRATYAIALDVGKKWTMTLDADILLTPTAIAELVGSAEQMPSHYLQVQGRILDKILGMYRQAGPRIYRSSLLPRALEHVPLAGAEIRPEFHVLQQMEKSGNPSRHVGPVLGLHDFEQYYRDLYRKSFVHASKHAELIPLILARCSRHVQDDPDFLIIQKGLSDGQAHRGSVSIDSTRYLDPFSRAQAELGLEEKGELSDKNLFEASFPDYFRRATKEPAPGFEIEEPSPVAGTDAEPLATGAQQLRVPGGRMASIAGFLKHLGFRRNS